MKKIIVLFLALALVFAFVGCTADKDTETTTTVAPETTTTTTTTTTAKVDDPSVKSEGVMKYSEYAAAKVDDKVVIEAYVQAKQSWWDNKATVYTQDEDGAYFIYNMACSEADYAKLTVGTKIKVTGYKADYAGEIEIADATFEILEGSFVASAEDITALLGTDELVNHQNKFVSFKGMTVESIGKDDSGNELAYFYKYNNAGQDGDDLYFKVSKDGKSYTFTVESYLCDKTTDVYAAVKGLKIGDKIDMEGFLYWYNGVNPHITSVKESVMTYAEYADAKINDKVVVETYVQAKQSWWDNKATVYTQDEDGAYFIYNMACSEADYAKLTVGTKIKVTGYKADYAGEVEIADATFEILEGSFVASAEDVTALLGTDELIKHQNEFVSFKGMTVESIGKDDSGNELAYFYKYNNAGQDGDDLYFKVSKDGKSYTFTVESYLCDKTTDVYAAVKGLKIGDKIDMEGFLYWYNGVNPHITSVTTAK